MLIALLEIFFFFKKLFVHLFIYLLCVCVSVCIYPVLSCAYSIEEGIKSPGSGATGELFSVDAGT